MRKILPDRVVIVKEPPPDKKTLRGPVEIFYEGKSLGIHEIDHSQYDPNKCSSLVQVNGVFVFAVYTLQDIRGLEPADVPYLVLMKDGKYGY